MGERSSEKSSIFMRIFSERWWKSILKTEMSFCKSKLFHFWTHINIEEFWVYHSKTNILSAENKKPTLMQPIIIIIRLQFVIWMMWPFCSLVSFQNTFGWKTRFLFSYLEKKMLIFSSKIALIFLIWRKILFTYLTRRFQTFTNFVI